MARTFAWTAVVVAVLGAGAAPARAGCTGGADDVCIVRVYNDAQSADWLADWMVVQRASNGTAQVPVPFRYKSTINRRFDARVVAVATGLPLAGFDWLDHSLSLTARTTLTLAELVLTGVPQGGNYRVETRLVTVATGAVVATDAVDQVAVGDVFLAGGQSNMVGSDEPKAPVDQYETPDDRVHLFGNDYVWKRAGEPMGASTRPVDAHPIDSAPDHSLMLRFGKEILAGTNVPVGVIPGPRAATCLIAAACTQPNWQRNASNHLDRTTLYGSLTFRGVVQRYRTPVRGVLWYQGESDTSRTTAEYLAALQTLVANWRADLANANLFFSNVQLASVAFADEATLTSWLGIQEAQRELLADAKSTLIATVDLPHGLIHLSIDGYKEAGRRLAAATLRDSYGVGSYRQARVGGACVEADHADRVDVSFDRAVQVNPASGGADPTPLFRVSDGGTAVAVTGVTINGATVTLQLAQPIATAGGCCGSTAATVSYGYSSATNAPWLVGADGSGAALTFRSLRVGS